MKHTYAQLKALLDDPDVDAKTVMELPESVRYVYFRYPHTQQHASEIMSIKTVSVFRSILLALLAGAAYYEGHLERSKEILLFLVFYEYGYTTKRLETERTDFSRRTVEYDLLKRLPLREPIPRQHAADQVHDE